MGVCHDRFHPRARLLDEHARHCVMGAGADAQAERTDELMAAVARLMRRG